MMRTYALVLLLLSLTVETSYSEPLPKGAVPLTASETRALFAGKTWRYGPDACNENDTGRVTFFADGRTRGIADLGVKRPWAIFWGTWSVNGNQICMTNRGRTVDGLHNGKERRCEAYFRSGKTVYGINTYCQDRRFGRNDYFRVGSRKVGDLTAPEFDQLKKKLGQ